MHIRRTLPPLSFSRRRYALPPPCWRRTRESAPIATLRPPCAPLPLPPPPPHSPSSILLPFLPISRHRARVRVSPPTTTTTFSYLHTIGQPDVLLTGNVSFRVAAPFRFGVGPPPIASYTQVSRQCFRCDINASPFSSDPDHSIFPVIGDHAYRAIQHGQSTEIEDRSVHRSDPSIDPPIFLRIRVFAETT